MELYDRIVDKKLLVRRVNVSANHIIDEGLIESRPCYEQLDIFTDYELAQKKENQKEQELKKERAIQEATLEIKSRYGKNAILKGFNLQEGATTKERNKQIGGHKA